MRTRICMLAGNFDLLGGMELQALRLGKSLRDLGARVIFIAGCNNVADPRLLNHEVYPLPFARIRVGWIAGIFQMITTVWKLFTLRNQYDLIHAHHINPTGITAVIAGKLIRKPVIAKVPCAGSLGSFANLRRSWGYALRRRLLLSVDRVIALTPEIEQEASEFGFTQEQILSIPNGIDIHAFQPPSVSKNEIRKRLRLPEAGPLAIMVAHYSPRKRHGLLIQAWRQVMDCLPDARLLLLGNGICNDQLKALIADLRLEKSIFLIGAVEPLKVVEYYQASDLFVLPSVAEGLPNAMLEAMACGLPVLVTDLPGHQSIITSEVNGWLMAKSAGEAELAERLLKILPDRQTLARVAAQAVDTIHQDFSLEAISARYLLAYSQVLDSSDWGKQR